MDKTKEDLAWAAGLFEGEGCFCWVKIPNRNNRPTPYSYCQASLHTTDKDVLEKFVSVIGFGKVNGPYIYTSKTIPMRKPSWYWAIRGYDRFQAVVDMLWPWLGKRRRAKAKEVLALELKKRPVGKRTRDSKGRYC